MNVVRLLPSPNSDDAPSAPPESRVDALLNIEVFDHWSALRVAGGSTRMSAVTVCRADLAA